MNKSGFQRAAVLWSCPRKVGQGRKTAGFELRAGFLPWYPLYFNFLFFMLESKKNGSHPKTSHYGEAFVAHKKMV